MKTYLVVVLMLFASVAANPQSAAVVLTDVEKVQTIVGSLVSERLKAEILLRDLAKATGYVSSLDEDAFYLSTDKNSKYKGVKILYTDVLAIASKKGSLSLIPDPKTAPYGVWTDLKKLIPNTLIEITDKNGDVTAARFRSTFNDTLKVADRETSAERTLQRSDIAFVHRVKYGVSDVSGGLSGGTRKGAKVGQEVGKAAGGITGPISGQSMGDGTGAAGAAMGAGIGALIGVIGGAASKTNGLRVLIYSR